MEISYKYTKCEKKLFIYNKKVLAFYSKYGKIEISLRFFYEKDKWDKAKRRKDDGNN